MTETDTTASIDISAFTLKLEEPIQITLPPMPVMTEADVDAQLLAFLATEAQGSGLDSIEDLDDKWAQAVFPGISGLKEYRSLIMKNGEQENKHAYQNLKVTRISEALANSLEGIISQEVIEASLAEVRERTEEAIYEAGSSVPQYMMDNNLDEESYLAKIREETERDIALGIALDLYIEQGGADAEVADEEIVRYLMTHDVEEFMQELRTTGQLEAARAAAARIKVMRHLMENAVVTIEG